ncbi:tRNA pseudouridine(38-40) synthase [Erysipelotrichaceae bacterium]|nr:tRNA pseudouridine(38-40) synthase [Erysipelotrichaceae bacterium]
MKRMKIIFSYDGSSFSGYQRQPGKMRTVQGEIERILEKIDVKPILIVASGRTDAKVHAYAQVAHFDIERTTISADNLYNIFRCQLPADIVVHSVEHVDADFHSRFRVVNKEYWYKFRSTKRMDKSPFATRYITYVPDEIDVDKLNAICRAYIGTHDFAAFTTASKDVSAIRTISYFYCMYDESEKCYIFKIKGTGFLQYMIRILVAFMFEIYRGKELIEKIDELYLTADKEYVHVKMVATGLYLKEVEY